MREEAAKLWCRFGSRFEGRCGESRRCDSGRRGISTSCAPPLNGRRLLRLILVGPETRVSGWRVGPRRDNRLRLLLLLLGLARSRLKVRRPQRFNERYHLLSWLSVSGGWLLLLLLLSEPLLLLLDQADRRVFRRL